MRFRALQRFSLEIRELYAGWEKYLEKKPYLENATANQPRTHVLSKTGLYWNCSECYPYSVETTTPKYMLSLAGFGS